MYAFVEIKEIKAEEFTITFKITFLNFIKNIPRKWFSKIKWKYIMNLKYFATSNIYHLQIINGENKHIKKGKIH